MQKIRGEAKNHVPAIISSLTHRYTTNSKKKVRNMEVSFHWQSMEVSTGTDGMLEGVAFESSRAKSLIRLLNNKGDPLSSSCQKKGKLLRLNH